MGTMGIFNEIQKLWIIRQYCTDRAETRYFCFTQYLARKQVHINEIHPWCGLSDEATLGGVELGYRATPLCPTPLESLWPEALT